MDRLPQPPSDPEARNIIDKLAQFVARNGPEFEQMTRQKQRDNPRFAFLFDGGGESYHYYTYKVNTEQAILRQQQQQQQHQQYDYGSNYGPPPPHQSGPPPPHQSYPPQSYGQGRASI